MALTEELVLSAMRQIMDPQTRKDIVSLGFVRDVVVSGTSAAVTLELPENSGVRGSIRGAIREVLAKVGVTKVTIDLPGAEPESIETTPAPKAAEQADPVLVSPLPQVKYVLAVGAGKGGVGKSTIALNLAIGLQRRGLDVGLMDGDIYGPSMPTMLGIKGQVPGVIDTKRGKMLRPMLVHGIHAITIGSIVEDDKPLVWRGPRAHGAFKQLLVDNVEWPKLDYLIIDLPPGTGDVAITLGQVLPVTGAIIVATPQQVALDDAIRAIGMFKTMNSPILGMVENMSYFVDESGIEHDIFGRGGCAAAANRLGYAFLGAVPLITDVRVHSDLGRPHANFEKNPKLRASLEAMVERVVEEVEKSAASKTTPTLEIA